MNWKKSLFVVVLTGITILGVAGCNNNIEETAAATASPTPSLGQPAPALKQPGFQSDNGTMPAPPDSNIAGEEPPVPTMDLAAAAAQLGVTEPELTEALGDAAQEPLDLKTAAEKLGVSEESLREALGMPEGGFQPGGPPPGGFEPDVQVQ